MLVYICVSQHKYLNLQHRGGKCLSFVLKTKYEQAEKTSRKDRS